MTEEAKQRYDEDRPYYDIIRTIIKEEVRPIVKEEVKQAVSPISQRQNWFYSLALVVFGFMFGVQFFVWKELSGKANANEVLDKLQYYQLEVDEHTMMKEIFINPSRSIYVFDQINNNMQRDLGFKFVNRSGTK